jgi:hypothetical protein
VDERTPQAHRCCEKNHREHDLRGY